MDFVKDNWTGIVKTVTVGNTAKDGGTRDRRITIGGQTCMPFLFNDGKMPNKPVVAFEISDIFPEDWPEALKDCYKGVLNDPVMWASKCVKDFNAELIFLSLDGVHPEGKGISAGETVLLVKRLAKEVKVPLIINGCGEHDKDNEVLPKVSEALHGEGCIIGSAIDKNYKTLAASCIADGHIIIAESPIDVNIAKQVNIMIHDMGLALDRIIMNPTTGALGYGIEYSYSIMERSRFAALNGDQLLSMPFISLVGQDAWKTKEARASLAEQPSWGEEIERGIEWEIQTASIVIQSGADILVMRHPRAVNYIKNYIDKLSK